RTVSALAVPMIDHTDRAIGVLQVINKKRSPHPRLDPEAPEGEVQPFGARDQEIVTFLASLAAVVAVKGRQAEAARRDLEGQLRQAQKMEAIGRLAGGIAHDFNNLLTVIIGRNQLLLWDFGPDDPLRRNVELIDQAAGRAATLTKQLLAFSRKQMLQPKVLDLNEVVLSADAILRRVLGEDIDLQIRPDRGLRQTRADPTQLEQVILNLAVNARDAMPRGGVLSIETGNVELGEEFVHRHAGARPGRYVMMAIRDTGIGMGPEVLAHLFEPFFTTKEPGKGTGLGLATVYGIVKQHEGYIGVESQPGGGTTFTIYLPRVDEAIRGLEPSAERPKLAAASETILLVEDEDALRVLACEILQKAGYTVLEARHGVEALARHEPHAGAIHLLLTDVVMPEMSGRALADRLVVARPGIRVLYMSGYTADAIVHHGVLESGIHLLLKPFTPDALMRKVREVLDHTGPVA
ncbi:MAG: ATP-binding protein, partial [Candidatus Rokuibacteriota bacterium]